MSSLNRVLIIGNLTREPELRTVGSGATVCDLGIAMNRSWTDNQGQKHDEATFVDVTLWGKNAENSAKFLSKGRSVFIEGRLQLDTWKDAQTGQDRNKLRVVGERVQFLGSAPESGEGGSQEQVSRQGARSSRQGRQAA
ncbi:MAG: single-stranded DNA-binding protein [Verrucomicrobiae bacterium]|nr:single-stranded DNA-binding protein [Verrucomicrobiae bacterium]